MNILQKLIVSVLTLCFLNQGEAQETEIWKLFTFCETVILIDTDYQIWQLEGLKPNEQSWGEWLLGSSIPQPDERYYYNPYQWKEGMRLLINHSPWTDSDFAQSYRNDTSQLKFCDYLVENLSASCFIFARQIDMNDLETIFEPSLKLIQSLNNQGQKELADAVLRNIRPYLEFFCDVIEEWQKRKEGQTYDEKLVAFADAQRHTTSLLNFRLFCESSE